MKAISLPAILLFACTSCATLKPEVATTLPGPSITFFTLSIRQAATGAAPAISIISRTTVSGTFKKGVAEDYGRDYLSLYLLNESGPLDSVRVAHPLHKHLEYAAPGHTFATKDTVLDAADFFVRFRIEGRAAALRITETLRDSATRTIAFLKL